MPIPAVVALMHLPKQRLPKVLHLDCLMLLQEARESLFVSKNSMTKSASLGVVSPVTLSTARLRSKSLLNGAFNGFMTR